MLDDEHLKEAFTNAISSSKYTVELLAHLIDKSGCFRQGLAKDDSTETYNRGYGDFGLYIRSLFLQYAPKKYLELIEERTKENDTAD